MIKKSKLNLFIDDLIVHYENIKLKQVKYNLKSFIEANSRSTFKHQINMILTTDYIYFNVDYKSNKYYLNLDKVFIDDKKHNQVDFDFLNSSLYPHYVLNKDMDLIKFKKKIIALDINNTSNLLLFKKYILNSLKIIKKDYYSNYVRENITELYYTDLNDVQLYTIYGYYMNCSGRTDHKFLYSWINYICDQIEKTNDPLFTYFVTYFKNIPNKKIITTIENYKYKERFLLLDKYHEGSSNCFMIEYVINILLTSRIIKYF